MTTSANPPREQYATDGITTTFTIHFQFFEDTDVNAIFVDSAGGVTTLALSTDYTVSGGNGAGGTLTTTNVLAAGGTLTTFREIPFTQESDYVEDDPFPPETVESDFDRAVMRDQQLQDATARSLTFPVTIDPNVSAELPTPVGGSVLGWASDGLSIENKTLPSGTAVYSTIANTRLGTATAEAVTPDSLASLWQEGAALVSAASIAKPGDANLGGYYTQSGNTGTNSYWAGLVGGELMEIRYTGTPLLGTSGNLVPPGGAAFQTVAGDIIRWRWDASATKWRACGGIRADGRAMVATAIPTQHLVAAGSVEYSANADLTTAIPADDTIPASTEGTQILTVDVTTTSATQKVRLRFNGFGSVASGGQLIAALFQGTTCIGVAIGGGFAFSGTEAIVLSIAKEVLIGSATTTTFSVRVGAAAGTVRMNGTLAGRLFGGAAASTLTYEVIEP